jgi:hypothetical protein
MATFTKLKLSGSTDGKPVKVAATATAGTTIHTAHASALDMLWLWVTNTDTSDRTLTIEFGSVTDPDGLIVKAVTIPASSVPIPIVTGQLLTNSMVVGAFASSANKLLITGYVDRIA